MRVVLTNNLKPRNSTKVPYMTIKLECEGYLVNDTSVVNPSVTFRFENVDSTINSPISHNYIYIPDFKRYYFINNWTVSGDFWTAHCTVDVLASFKDVIGMSEQYVLRSSAEHNPNLIDSLYPLESSCEVVTGTVAFGQENSIWIDTIHSGYFILGVVAKGVNNLCGITYYTLNFDQMAAFTDYLMKDVSWAGIEELSDGLSKALFNPMQYLVSCTWFPRKPKTIPLMSNELQYGFWSFYMQMGELGVPEKSVEQNLYLGIIDIPYHPDSGSDYSRSYLSKPPFTSAKLYIQPFGIIDIPLSMCNSNGGCYAFVDLDPLGGAAILRLTSDREGSHTIAYKSADYGVPIKFSQLTTDVKGFGLALGADIMANAIGDFADKVFGGNISNHISGIASAVEAGFTKADAKGNSGAFLSYQIRPSLVTTFCRQAERDVQKHGLPLCKKRVISKIPGYIMCEGAKFEGHSGVLLDEKTTVENYMNTGFYYE